MRVGSDKRGSATDRKKRRDWLLLTYGDGTRCRCAHCNKSLTANTLEVDRIQPGGSYRHENIQPACGYCNRVRSNKIEWVGVVRYQTA